MFEIGRLTRLNLGYTGEANSRPIEICVADWLADWPGAAIGLLLRRPGEDTFYTAKTSVENSVLKYTPTRADVELPGDGLAQIVLTDENDVELRSRVVRTCIEPSLPGSEAEEPEEPMRPFVDQVLEAAARAEAAADEAQTAVEYVAEDAERAVAAADNAEAAAKRAEEAAGMIGPGGGGTGTVTSVNGVQPDEAGNVEIDIPEPPTKLGELEDDAEHRLVSDTEKAAWDAKSNFSGKYEDLSGKPTIPTKLSEMAADATHRLVTDTEKSAWNAKSTFSGKYADLTGKPTIPNVPSWALQPSKPTYTAAEVGALPSTYTPPNQTAAQVGADPAGTAASKVSTHNSDEDAHPAIRQLISDLSGRLSALADSDDTTLDQLSEIVTYIKANKTLIDSITTGKVSTADIVNNLTTNTSTKPLSAAQGVALKKLIDAIVVPTKLSELEGDATHRVVTDAEKTAWNAKSTFSGAYADLTGKPTIPTKTSQLTNDSGYLTEHQDISHLLPRTELGAAVDVALAEAKASGEFDGEDGKTPVVGVDYYTHAEKAEFSEYIASELAKRGQLKPEFANSIEECTDTSLLYVLPDGYIYAYIATVTEGDKVPNFTNLMDDPNAYIKDGYRYSYSSAAFKAQASDCAIVVPIPPTAGAFTIRAKETTHTGCAYAGSVYFGENNQTFAGSNNASNFNYSDDGNGTVTYNQTSYSGGFKYYVFHVASGVNAETLVVTLNEEITYTTTEGGIEYQWTSTGHAFVPADYEGRIVANEQNISTLQTETKNLADRLDGLSINAGGSTENIVFSIPAFAPVPQKAPTADGGGIMDVRAIRTDTYYEYMDGLVAKHPNYLYKQYMGKDMTNTYDHYRYIACRSYYHAWVLDNYPKMFGWKNGDTVVYSVSVSPRVGDAMYSTPYIGTVHGTVAVVNCNFDPVKASTRTVGDVEFERYAAADVEPTVVYTTVKREYEGCTVYSSTFASSTTVYSIADGVMTCADGKTYTRYPFEDRRNDKSKPLSIFILSNEHAGCNWGDSSIVSIIVAQFLTDLCENKNIPFLRWLKNNCMITTIPIGNPWGYSEDSIAGYDNGNAVNINRNYDTPGWCLGEYDLGTGHGEYAGSENETQHIMNTIHLCNADVGMSMHGVGHHNETPTQDGYIQMQGNGFDSSIRRPIDEIMTTSYNLGLEGDTTVVNDPYHAGKSPSYIQWAGAVGGLTETVPWNALTGEYFDSVSMEAGYTEMLLFLQCWIKEALQKAAE